MLGAREFVIATRKTGPEDLWSSAIAGFGSGALLGRLYGIVLFHLLSSRHMLVIFVGHKPWL